MKIKRILSLLLCLCLTAAMLPTVALAAADPSAIRLDAANSFGITGGGANWVYYGEYGGSPVKWRVLSTTGNGGTYSDGTNAVTNPLFLLSEYLLDYNSVLFNSVENNAWQGSMAQGWCGDFYSNNFDTAEQSAVAATAKTDSSFTSSNILSSSFAGSSNILSSDKVFFLSAEEAETSSYGFSSDSDRIAKVGSNAGLWWLRSPYASYTYVAGMVRNGGNVSSEYVLYALSARPAFNLNLSSVLFSSAAVGGKSSGVTGAGALTTVSSTAPTEWKLTLRDSGRAFDVTESAATRAAGSSVTLNYTNAATGPDEYISAMLVDGSSNVLYYGRIKATTAAGDASGTVDVTIPAGLADGSYTLKLFSEQYNGDYKTDYASSFSDVALTVDATAPDVSNSFGIKGYGTNWVYYGEYNGSPVMWRVLAATGGNDGAYEDNNGDSIDGSEAMFLLSETLMADVAFDSTGTSNAWQGSTAQDWCGDFYSNNFDTAEQSAIAATAKTDSSFTSSIGQPFAGSSNILSSDKVFFLSAEEAETPFYGFPSWINNWWWLRSPHEVDPLYAGIVFVDGSVANVAVDTTWSARPAFNLNLSSVLFSSAAEGGKSSGVTGAGALTAVSSTAPTEWKLTLRDSGRAFDVTESGATGAAGGTITLNYTGATAYNSSSAPNEYISAMIADSTDNILYYGRLAQPASANGAVDVTLPSGLADGSYTLKLFSEQYNGDKETDYASAFQDLSLAVDNTAPTVTGVTPDGTGVSITTATLSVTFSEAMDTGTTGTVAPDNGATVQNPQWSNGDKTVTYDLSDLAYGTDYSITVSGFKDAAGNTIADDSTHGFTTANAPDTNPPTVTGVTPDGTGVSISGNIAITFSEAMNTTVAGAVYLSNNGGTTYASALTGGNWSVVGTVYSIGYSGLSYSTAYTVLISDFKDVAGNVMTADSTHSFTTCVEPLIPSVSPSTLTINKGGTASFTVAFGQGGAAATDAAITVGDSGIASVSQTQVTTPGSVTVTGLAVGTTDITMVFNDTASTTATVSVTVQAIIPTWPSGSSLTASGVTRTDATLSWTGAQDITAVTGYKLYQDGAEIATVAGDVYSCTVTGLSPSTSYTFQVQAGNADGQWTTNGPAVTVRTQSSGSSGGGSSSTPSKPTYTADVKADNGADTTLTVTVNTNTGSAAVNIGAQQGNTISGGGNLTITMPSIPGVSSYSLGVPVAYLTTPGGGSLTFDTDTGSITLPADMLAGISGAEGKRAEITIGQGDKSGLPDSVKAAVGDRPLIQLSLTLDGKQTDWSNPDSPVTISIPYTPTAAELANPESIVIWYIDGSGNTVCIPNGHYDPVTSTVTFSTTHFSLYAVVYNPVSFNDVKSGVWYYEAVSFIAARDITDGTGRGNFSPDAHLTRGEFLVMLMKAYGIAPDTNPADNFSDAGSTYYTGYLAAAKRLGISAGVGNNLYAPGKEITRQEMFALLYNALKVIGQLPGTHWRAVSEADDQPQGDSGNELSGFSDAGQIDSWAKEALKLLVETGTVSGNAGKLSPTSTTTRAEFAQVLYNLLGK